MKKPNKKEKLLILTTTFEQGGAEKQLFQLTNFLKKIYEIQIISLIDGPYHKKYDELGIETIILGSKYNIPKLIYKINQKINAFKPHIINSFLFQTNILLKLVYLFKQKKEIIICNYRSVLSKLPLIRILETINKNCIDANIANSKAAFDDLEKYKFLKNHLVENAFKPPILDQQKVKELIKKFKKPIILTVANNRKEKGYPTLLQSIKTIERKKLNYTFICIGNDTEKLPKHKNTFYLGHQEIIPEYMQIADLLVLPSHFESQSNVLMEAMYSKLPIITTDVVGNRELLEEGAFFPVKNHEKLTALIIKQIKINNINTEKNYEKIIHKRNQKTISSKYLNILQNMKIKKHQSIFFRKNHN